MQLKEVLVHHVHRFNVTEFFMVNYALGFNQSDTRKYFEILATGQSDIHCKIKETLLTGDLKPVLNENVGSEKLFPADLTRSVYFHLLFHCHYFPYLVLAFMFKFNCSFGNCHF